MAGAQGRFLWHELLTTDIDQAKAFYTETLGWRTRVWEDAHTLWMVGQRPIGGVIPMPPAMQQAGVVPHWLTYIASEDVTADCQKTAELGGKILNPGEERRGVGRLAVLADPQGAVFAVFRPEQPMQTGHSTEPMSFGWAELHTTDYEAAWQFYSKLFDWKYQRSRDLGHDVGAYLMFRHALGEHSIGGMSNAAKGHQIIPHWLHYVNVDSVGQAVERIRERGGTVRNGPFQIPGESGWVAQCADPQGARFGIYSETP